MAIKIGDRIPTFELKNQKGELIKIENYLNKSSLVIYFYPKDDTPGCTKEACSFNDKYEVFTEYGAEVFGISSDDVASHNKFASRYNLKFNLLSDTGGEVRKAFGVPNNLIFIPGRVTYIVNKEGVVTHMYNSQINAEKHIKEALNQLEADANN